MTCQRRACAILSCILATILVLTVSGPVYAQGQDSKAGDLSTLFQQESLSVHTKSSVLIEASSGQILTSHNKDEKIPPASFAKLLTLYVIFDLIKSGKISLKDEIYISQKAWKTGGSKMFVELGSRVPLENIIKGIAVISGNDACIAAAEHAYGSVEAFVNVMNDTAKKLGMTSSHFDNPHGLPSDDQYTTVYDMAILARSYLHDFPQVLQYHSLQEFTYSGIHQFNRNRLLKKDPSVDGLKTGYVEAAGYHLLATANRDNRRLIAVVMGAEKPIIREQEALKLLNYGFHNFVFMSLFKQDEILHSIPVWKGKENVLPIVSHDSGMIIVPEAYKNDVKTEERLPAYVIAPIHQNQEIGQYIVNVHGKVVKSIPLMASVDIQRAGIFKVVYHNMYLLGKGKTLLFVLGVALALVFAFVILSFLGRRRRRSRLRVRL